MTVASSSACNLHIVSGRVLGRIHVISGTELTFNVRIEQVGNAFPGVGRMLIFCSFKNTVSFIIYFCINNVWGFEIILLLRSWKI